MLLRPRQKDFVERSLVALKANGNALGIAPTGAGKTILFSEIIGQYIKGTKAKTLVLAHRALWSGATLRGCRCRNT